MSRAELMTIHGSKYHVPAILRLMDAEAVAAYSGTVRAGIELVARLIRDLQAENAELRERLAEAERDAARYRWLTTDSRNAISACSWTDGNGHRIWRVGKEIDAAIDAAKGETS